MGSFIKWKPEYSVGIEKIDNQHIKLVEMINELYTAFTNKNPDGILLDILNKLSDYSMYHFSTEEQLFIDSKYPATICHIEEHHYFKKTISQFIQDIQNGETVTYKVLTFLNAWLVDHIKEEDRKYSKHLLAYLEKHHNEMVDR